MRLGLAVVLLLGASVAHADVTTAIERRDAKALSAMLATPLIHEGLWFPDAACTKRFGRGGVLRTGDRDAFARCLARYVPQLSTRRSGAPGGSVLTVQPGVEIEVIVAGDQIRWIGSAGGAGDDNGVPMLTAQAFEALRTKGTTMLDDAVRAELEPELVKADPASAWIRTCVDTRGVAVRTVAWAATPRTGEVFLRATADWAFRAFTLRGAAIASPANAGRAAPPEAMRRSIASPANAGRAAPPIKACSLSLLTYPAGKAPGTETLPLHPAASVAVEPMLEVFAPSVYRRVPPPPPASPVTISQSELVSLALAPFTPAPASSDQLARAGARSKIAVRVCIDTNGTVTSARTITSHGTGSADRLRLDMIRRWRISPYVQQGTAVAACAVVQFVATP